MKVNKLNMEDTYMNANVLDKLTYGLFILTSKKKDKATGCIVDTCIQVGTNPDRILVSVQNSNYTRKIIDKSGVFCVAILDEDCPFELIKHFGFQSGRDVDKFEGLTTFEDYYGVPCVLSHVCAAISAKVIDSVNIGSHTIYIGDVKEVKDISNKTPMTYAYYQNHVDPGTKKEDDMENSVEEVSGWRCTICGSVYSDKELPNDYICGVCGHPSTDFVSIYEEY